jgi:ankyrin repeat protein
MPWPDDSTQEGHGAGFAHDVSIHQAAVSGDLAKVSDLLDGGVDINSRDESLQTALHCAIRNDSSSMVQLLLSRGADTSLRDNGTFDEPDGFIPVETAARCNAIAAMQELIAHGVDFESSKAIFLAAKENHMDMLRLLFEKISGSLLDTLHRRAIADALRVSAKNQNLEMVQFILQRFGSERDTNAHDDYRQFALDNALLSVFDCDCADGNVGLLDYIRDQQWDHAVHIIDVLIYAGASVNTHGKDPLRRTALHAAIAEQGPPVILITSLLNHGADPNSPDSSERSPFFQLLGDPRATEELVKIFTDAGAVVGSPAAGGQTPLHHVRKPSIASWLIASGADVGAMDYQGEIPLHKASSLGMLELVSLYLDAGSPVDVRNNLGWTPFMQSSSASISRALLNHGTDIHAATSQGTTAIHKAAASCKLELVSFLLANGANIHGRAIREDLTCGSNERTTVLVEGYTPLHLAIASAHGAFVGATLEVVTALLNHGAEIEAREGTGKTPLLLAISRNYNSNAKSCTHNEKVVNYLLERGADPYAVDDAGKDAFELAGDRNYTLSEVGKFERKPAPPISVHERNMGPGRGRGRGAYGRGGFHS